MLIFLLLLFGISLSKGTGIIIFLLRRAQRKRVHYSCGVRFAHSSAHGCSALWPGCWLAVKSCNPRAVASALGLRNPKPCSWLEGLAGDEKVFIAPPVKGWILVMGTALLDPSEDVDACYRFILDLSRQLGQVQFFTGNRLSRDHGWVEANGGRVVRAYAWAGKTLWNQGPRTPGEEQLGLKCYEYAEPAQQTPLGQPDVFVTNVEKVPLLAAHWGFDPAWIDERALKEQGGIAGELSRGTGAASKRGRHR
jgi:hypothetical protein